MTFLVKAWRCFGAAERAAALAWSAPRLSRRSSTSIRLASVHRARSAEKATAPYVNSGLAAEDPSDDGVEHSVDCRCQIVFG